jgi:hypothetical protein
MGTPRRGHRLGGALAAAFATTGFVALLASGGCEFVVGDAVPSFTCLPGTPNNCPSGQVCIPSTHQCVPQAGTCTAGAASGCSAGLRCDEQTLRCTGAGTMLRDAAGDAVVVAMSPDGSHDGSTAAPDGPVSDATGDARDVTIPDAPTDIVTMCRGVACGCTGPADCDSGVCANSLTATTALSNELNGMSFCTQPCCTSADCPMLTVCFGTGGGGNYCVKPGWLARTADLGAGQGGASCSNSSECRSGLCDSTSKCADTCCSSAQQSSECASGAVCRYAAFPGNNFDTHETAWCGPQVGTGAGGAPCALDNSCQSGKCATFNNHCEAVCRATADCSSGQACSYGTGPTTIPANKDIVAGCMAVTGTVQNGGACMNNADCLSAFCDGSKCTDVCATDADCKGGLHCRPVQVQVSGSYSVLCCE